MKNIRNDRGSNLVSGKIPMSAEAAAIAVLLRKLVMANRFYSEATEAERGRIFDAMEKSTLKLEKLSDGQYGRDFSVLYIIYGDVFLREEPTLGYEGMEELISLLDY